MNLKDKRVVLLTQFFPPEMGAPQSRIYELCIALNMKGWEVLVITALPNYPKGKIFPEYKGKYFVSEEINGIMILRYPIYPSNSKKTFPRVLSMISFSISSLFSLIRIRRFRPQYIITESPPLTLAYTGALLSFLSKAKNILNVSDIWPLSAHELGAISNGFLYNFLQFLENRAYLNAFACFGQSEEIVSHILTKGGKRVFLFRNGVDSSRFPVIDYKYSGNLKIVYMGLLGIAQGILALCKNIDFKKLGFEFHIYGQGAERDDLEQFVSQFGSDKGIYLHQSLLRQQVPIILTTYDLTIIPLIKPIYGAVPSKIYEAMAASLPILFAGGGEGAKIVNTYKVGWVIEPSDYKAINKQLQQLRAFPIDEWRNIRKRTREVAELFFNRKLQIDNFEAFLNANIKL